MNSTSKRLEAAEEMETKIELMTAALPTTFHIGITGHRPPLLAEEHFDAVERKIEELLTEARKQVLERHAGMVNAARKAAAKHLPGETRFRLIGQLAEGADRLAARAALESGMEIQAILPFSRDEFERDFQTGESQREFRELLAQATAVLELDGCRDDEGTAYLNAGRAMLDHIDLLIAVWDEKPARGRGGTAEVVSMAAALGIPVYVVTPEREAAIKRYSGSTDWRKDLAEVMRGMLILPAEDGKRCHRFQHEKIRRFNWGWLFRSFRNFYTNGSMWGGSFLWPEPIATTRRDWEAARQHGFGQLEKLEAAISSGFLEPYARADHLANYYAGLFRSAYLTRYLLGGLMACLVAVGFYTKDFQWQGFVAQMIVLGLLLLLVRADQSKKWHQHSLEYRSLAENLRLLRFLWPLGAGFGPLVRSSNRLRESPLWVIQEVRRTVRAAGVPNLVVTRDFLARHRDFFLKAEIDEQINYHKGTAKWQETLAKRLRLISMGFFLAGVVALGVRAGFYTFCPKFVTAPLDGGPWNFIHYSAYWSKVLSVVFPALGGLYAGIRSHGEFARLAARSKAMAAHLESIKVRLQQFPPNRWDESVSVTGDLATEMTGEVADWRTLIGGKGLSAPV